MPPHSISKSVGRIFEILEHFKTTRAACSTAELETALGYPYSSARVILKTMTALGYLAYDAEARTYFPTQQLSGLTGWIQKSSLMSRRLKELITTIGRETGEATGLATRSTIFCNWIQVVNASEVFSFKLAKGVGLTLANSATGRVILSQMSADEIDQILQYSKYWARNAQVKEAISDRSEVYQAIAFVREHGYLCGYDTWLKGVGTIAYPIPSSSGTPMAAGIMGSTVRIKEKEAAIRHIIEENLSRFLARTAPAPVLAG